MSKKLFVGGLAWATESSSLQTVFGKYGEVTEAVVVTERDTDRSRGFGFVTFAEAQHADEAVAELNGSTLDGRQIVVNVANDRPKNQRGRDGFGSSPRNRW
jgi:RNA recognition motif-containing protein